MTSITPDTYNRFEDAGTGYCSECHTFNEGEGGHCEPDADYYTCANCGEDYLFGVLTAMMHEMFEVVELPEQENFSLGGDHD